MSDEKLKAYCNKCGHNGPVTANGEHLRPGIGDWCGYKAVPSPTPTAEKADVVEAVARAMAAAEGLNYDEVCGYETGAEECDSSTCIAAHYEDHDADFARGLYDRLARAAIAALQSRPAEPAGEEPVAWMYDNGGSKELTRIRWNKAWREQEPETVETPLYAHPAPSNPDRLADHIAEFLFAVLRSPGCKYPVEDYYPADHNWSDESAPAPEPSWRVCENNAWVECVGGHKWKILPAGEIALYRHRLAALSAPALDGEKGE